MSGVKHSLSRQCAGLVSGWVFTWSLVGDTAASDWTQYRGANHDGISADRIATDWSGAATNPVWRVPLPNGLSSLTVSGGRVFTQVRRMVAGDDREVTVALDATTGQELWATSVDAANYPGGGVGYDDGPRSTPSVVGDSVYVLSSYLKLYRLKAADGAVVWQKDLQSLYGGSVIGWQNAASPLVEDGLIFVNANCSPERLLALHTSDGSLAWRSQNEAMTHSTPVLATLHGVRQVIFATQGGLVSLSPPTGERLWKFSYPFNYSTSLAASPVVYEDMVFIAGARSYGMYGVAMQATLANGTWTATQLWATNTLGSHWMTPVCHKGFLYGLFGIFQYDSARAQLKCVDLRTGREMWSTDDFGRGGIALADNRLVVLTEKGELALVQPVTNAYTELQRFQALPAYHPDTNKCWNSPAVADGKVYVRSTYYGAAFDLSVPDLQLDPQIMGGDGTLQLTVRTSDGSLLDSNRAAGLAIRSTTNLTLPIESWPALTNTLTLSNDTARITGLDLGPEPQRYFIVSEPR